MWWIKTWAWLKKYWKWIIFPVGALMAAAAFVAGRITTPDPGSTPPDLGDAGLDAVDAVATAGKERDEALASLTMEHIDRLQNLTDDQREELARLREKPTEEVVEWFNRLR